MKLNKLNIKGVAIEPNCGNAQIVPAPIDSIQIANDQIWIMTVMK